MSFLGKLSILFVGLLNLNFEVAGQLMPRKGQITFSIRPRPALGGNIAQGPIQSLPIWHTTHTT